MNKKSSTHKDAHKARQILHVTFGSVLTARDAGGAFVYYDRIMETLRSHAEIYASTLELHFLRHLEPFVAWSKHTA